MVTLDTTRADRLGSYGFAQASTPHLDRLASEGVRFERALSPVPLTLPAHASVMTGRNPYSHGVRNNGHFTLPADVPTLAEQFRAAGYDTAAFVSSFVLDRQFGLVRGFDRYDDTLDPVSASSAAVAPVDLERRGDRTVQAALTWLADRAATPAGNPPAAVSDRPRAPAARPYFLWVHLYDPHEPYAAPVSFASRFPGAPYDAEVAFVDAAVGELVAGVRSGSPAGSAPLVVVAGDHGESLGDHGESAHGLFVYESAIRVPLIAWWPGRLTPRVVRPHVRLIDVAPTVLAWAGLAAPAGVDGRDVSPLARGETLPPATAYAETYFPEFFMGWSPLRAIDDGRWKYINSPEPELYDVVADPREIVNRFDNEAATARSLRRQLEEAVRAADRAATTTLSTDAQRKLAALGYVSIPPTRAGGVPPAPARMVGLFERLTGGNRALAEGRASEAARIARAVLREDPDTPFAHLLLGRALLATGDPQGATRALATYLQFVPTSADAHHWQALAALQLGDRARALAEEEAALAIDARHAQAIALRAGLLFSSGKRDEGLAALAAAVDGQASNVGLRVDYADLLADAGRVVDAETEYRRALDARPVDLRARAGLGMLLAKMGRLDDAIAALTLALDTDPRHEEARIERAAAYARAGRAAESRADLERLMGPEVRPDIRRAAQRELARATGQAPPRR
jgi:choline-sulfatase